MSCHDWEALLAHRFEPGLERLVEWRAALAHLEVCSDCERHALRLDPSLGFAGAGAWAPAEDETEAIRQAVRTLRRSERLTGQRHRPKLASAARSSRWSAAALVAALLLLLPGGSARDGVGVAPEAQPLAPARIVRAQTAMAPAIDGLDRPSARIYELGGDDLSIVMVVDESLDV